MNRPILVLCNLLCAAAANGADYYYYDEFSTDPVESLNSTAPTTSAAGISDIHCTVQCSALGLAACAATAYLAETGVCLFSAVSNADFSAAAPHRWVKGEEQSPAPVPTSDPRYHLMLSRTKLSLSFARNWTEYENGFGDGIDLWLGLRRIHELTGKTPRKLRVEALSVSNQWFVDEYSGFSVGDASTKYTMTFDSHLLGSSNTTGDCLIYHKGMEFSTMDQDNDANTGIACGKKYGKGGWWFKSCIGCLPTGGQYNSRDPYIYWLYAGDFQKAIRFLLI